MFNTNKPFTLKKKKDTVIYSNIHGIKSTCICMKYLPLDFKQITINLS